MGFRSDDVLELVCVEHGALHVRMTNVGGTCDNAPNLFHSTQQYSIAAKHSKVGWRYVFAKMCSLQSIPCVSSGEARE